MTRRFFVAGNWKLNLAPQQAHEVATNLVPLIANRDQIDVALFPTAISLLTVLGALSGSGIEVGLQDIHTESLGAFTGANSASMARDVGCTRVLIGHSERRSIFGESNATTGLKVLVARNAGLLPILCVGETLQQRESGLAEEVVKQQLLDGLSRLEQDQISGIIIAYEPVWAIGTGVVSSPKQAQAMHLAIRNWLIQQYPAYIARETKIIYGGSVKPTNVEELMACPDIDGALVGGASLNAEIFAQIIEKAQTCQL